MKHFLLVILFLPVITGHGQVVNIDSLRMQYNQKTLRLNNRISMNGMQLETQTVKNLMLISPEATVNFNKYLKNRRTANILPLFGSVAVITGILVSQKNKGPGYAIIISGNTINLLGSLFRRRATNYLQDAVWIYNRDVLYTRR